jgi:hypothetical protein
MILAERIFGKFSRPGRERSARAAESALVMKTEGVPLGRSMGAQGSPGGG